MSSRDGIVLFVSGLVFGVLFSAGRAQALTEFCPAHLDRLHALDASAKGQPASLYSFEIGAAGPRTARGRFVVETDKGWYGIDFKGLVLQSHRETYQENGYRYDRTDYYSDVAYVRFAQPVVPIRSWVRSTTVFNDAPFTWDLHGMVSCAPSVSDVMYDVATEPASSAVRPELAILPQSTSSVIRASSIAAPPGLTESCSQPFVNVKMVDMVTPKFPQEAKALGLSSGVVLIAIAVDESGTLIDASIWASSGYEPFDKAALDAARESTYSAGVAYCRPAAGRYLFHVSFQ